MTPEWKLFLNFFPKSAFQPRFMSHGQIWRKSAIAKLPKSHLVLLTKKLGVGDTFEPPILPPLNRSCPKFCERCRPSTCACVLDFGPDRLRFAGLILERVQKSEFNQCRLSAYNYILLSNTSMQAMTNSVSSWWCIVQAKPIQSAYASN